MNRTTLRRLAGATAGLLAAGTPVAVATAAPARPAPCTATWVGSASSDWNTAANWSPAAVPTAASRACVSTATGPTVASGYAAVARNLVVTHSSVTVDGTLTTTTFSVKFSTLDGAGTLTATGVPNSQLSAVMVDGGLHVHARHVLVSGHRSMCGSQLSLCLNGVSQLVSDYSVDLDAAMVAGNSTASPVISASLAGVRIVGPATTNRISVDLDAGGVTASVDGGTLRLDRWEQFGADGTLSASFIPEGNTVVLPRTITAVTTIFYVGSNTTVETPDGTGALSTLTTIGAHATGSIALPPDVTPQGGTLTILPAGSFPFTLAATPTPTTVHGVLENDGYLSVYDDLRADTFVSTGSTSVADGAILTAGNANFSRGSFSIGRGSVVAPDGIRINGKYAGAPSNTCGTLDGNVTATAHSQMLLTLYTPDPNCSALYSTTGSFSLAGSLNLRTPGRVASGTQVVLIDAAGGLSGTFSSINDVNNRWTISYTATQVIATAR